MHIHPLVLIILDLQVLIGRLYENTAFEGLSRVSARAVRNLAAGGSVMAKENATFRTLAPFVLYATLILYGCFD